MNAPEFDFGPAERASRSYKRYVLAVDDAVQVLTLSVAARACGTESSRLRDALDGRKGSKLSTEWGAIVAERVGPGQYRDAIITAIRELFGLHQPESDAEYIHTLEGGYAEHGPQGLATLARLRRKARR